MISKTVTLYYCQFCLYPPRRKKSQRKHIIKRHEEHCLGNPSRTPLPGEVTSASNLEVLSARGPMPTWWPGVGKIWTGANWRDVPGYVPCDGISGEEWPWFDDRPLPKCRPWVVRLHLIGLEPEDLPDEVAHELRKYLP